jgi:hypothetical protein
LHAPEPEALIQSNFSHEYGARLLAARPSFAVTAQSMTQIERY